MNFSQTKKGAAEAAPFPAILERSERHASGDREPATDRIVGRRVHVAAVVRGRTDVAADDLGFVVEQVDHSDREREVLGSLPASGQIEVVLCTDRTELGVRYAEAGVGTLEVRATLVRNRKQCTVGVAVFGIGRSEVGEQLSGLVFDCVDITPPQRQIDIVELERGTLLERELRLNRRAVDAVVADTVAVQAGRIVLVGLELGTVRPVAEEREVETGEAEIGVQFMTRSIPSVNRPWFVRLSGRPGVVATLPNRLPVAGLRRSKYKPGRSATGW